MVNSGCWQYLLLLFVNACKKIPNIFDDRTAGVPYNLLVLSITTCKTHVENSQLLTSNILLILWFHIRTLIVKIQEYTQICTEFRRSFTIKTLAVRHDSTFSSV